MEFTDALSMSCLSWPVTLTTALDLTLIHEANLRAVDKQLLESSMLGRVDLVQDAIERGADVRNARTVMVVYMLSCYAHLCSLMLFLDMRDSSALRNGGRVP